MRFLCLSRVCPGSPGVFEPVGINLFWIMSAVSGTFVAYWTHPTLAGRAARPLWKPAAGLGFHPEGQQLLARNWRGT